MKNLKTNNSSIELWREPRLVWIISVEKSEVSTSVIYSVCYFLLAECALRLICLPLCRFYAKLKFNVIRSGVFPWLRAKQSNSEKWWSRGISFNSTDAVWTKGVFTLLSGVYWMYKQLRTNKPLFHFKLAPTCWSIRHLWHECTWKSWSTEVDRRNWGTGYQTCNSSLIIQSVYVGFRHIIKP